MQEVIWKMKRTVIAQLLVLVVATASTLADTPPQPIDFVSRIDASPTLSAQIGLQKLSVDEKSALNTLLNFVYESGVKDGKEPQQSPKAPSNQLPESDESTPSRSGKAYLSKVASAEDDLVRLEDGAIVEIKSGYLGYVGYRKDAVLFKDAGSWRIWIEGKKAFRCEVVRNSPQSSGRSAELVYITDVRANGQIIALNDGTLLEVDSLHTLDTGLWLGMSEAILLDGAELLNLEESGEIIPVTRLR